MISQEDIDDIQFNLGLLKLVRNGKYEIGVGIPKEIPKGIITNNVAAWLFRNAEAQNIANTMRENGYDLVELHSGLESRQRMQAIKMIQSQKKSYIVASDIASRGIDLEGITHVISCGFPKDLKFYIHRAGRTGRASRDGQCIALYKESDTKSIQSLIKQGIEFKHQDVKNKQFVDLKPYVNKRPMKKDAFHEEVEKIVHKKKKVKPNYKKRQRQEIDRMKRKKRREMIKSDIKRQQKERAKERQRQKGMDI